MLRNRGVRYIWTLPDEHRRTSAEACKSVELSEKPLGKLARRFGVGAGVKFPGLHHRPTAQPAAAGCILAVIANIEIVD